MKLRLGFVSNSSSSSFVIIARPVSPEDLERGNYDPSLLHVQGYGDGMYIFQADEEIIEYIKMVGLANLLDVELFELYAQGEDEIPLVPEKYIGLSGLVLKGGEMSYHYPTPEDFIEQCEEEFAWKRKREIHGAYR